MAQIGFVGLGNMGMPMVQNLLQADHKLQVFDINPTALQQAREAGATAVKDMAELAQNAEIIFTMLQTGEQVSSVCLGENNLFAQAKAGTLFIDCSSIAVTTCRELHQAAKAAGHLMVDAPVSGGIAGATAGTLTIMVGSDSQDFQAAKPILEVVGKNIIHAGPPGNGQVAKICNNMILGVSMIAISEAYSLAENLGLSAKKLYEICSEATGQCWALTNYSPVPGILENVPANNDFRPGFTSKMMLKDLNLSQEAAKSVLQQTPLGEHARDLYQQFVESDNAELDFSGIIKMLQKRE